MVISKMQSQYFQQKSKTSTLDIGYLQITFNTFYDIHYKILLQYIRETKMQKKNMFVDEKL